jgi:hypothetical protein
MSEANKPKRSAYQREMDAVHLSKDKADETLRLMLEKNAEVHARQEKSRKPRRTVWLASFAAAAAVLVMAVVLLRGGPALSWGSVRMRSLPLSGVRGEETVPASFRDVFGTDPENFFPGWTVVSDAADPAGRESRLTLKHGDAELRATVSEAEPALSAALTRDGVPEADGVRYNRDPDDGTLYALCVLHGRYVIFQSDQLTENAFTEAVRSVTGS